MRLKSLEDAFIVRDEELASQPPTSPLPAHTESESVGDFDQIAQDIIRRHARGKAKQVNEASEAGPSAMWMIRVPVGKTHSHKLNDHDTPQRRAESDIMGQLFATGKIPSMRTSSRLPGRIYAEVANRQAVVDACKGLRVFSFAPIPLEEWHQISVRGPRNPQDEPLNIGSWARLRRSNLYKGDLAYVLEVALYSDIVKVAVVPRIDYEPHATKRKGKAPIPDAGLFDPERIARIYGSGAVVERRDECEYLFQGSTYRRGLAIFSIMGTHTLRRELQPRLEELAPFKTAIFVDDNIDRSLHAASIHFWREGDRLEAVKGEFQGVRGHLSCVDFHLRSARMQITCKVTTDGRVVDFPQEILDVPLEHLRRLLLQGDGVRVVAGNYRGRQGIVFSALDEDITFFDTQTSTLVSQTNVIRSSAHQLQQLEARREFFETHDPEITHKVAPGTGFPGKIIRTEPRNPLIGKHVVVLKGHQKGFWGYVTEVGNKGVVVNFPQRYASDQTFPMSSLAEE